MLPWYFALTLVITVLVYFICACLFYIWRTSKIKARAQE